MKKKGMIQTRGLCFPVHSNGPHGGSVEFTDFNTQLNKTLAELHDSGAEIIDIKYSTIQPFYHADQDGHYVSPHYQGEYTALILYRE